MSLRYEQYGALKRTRDFLRQIIAGEYPKTRAEMRKMASGCLRHFPPLNENGKPSYSRDEFTTEEGGPTS